MLGLATGIYFVWGATLEAEYDRRVEALRDQGDYVETPQSPSAETPATENAVYVLAEAGKLLANLQRDDEELAGALAVFTKGVWGSELLVPEDYERLRREWPKLDGYFAQLNKAMEKPVFAPQRLGERTRSLRCRGARTFRKSLTCSS